MAWRYLASFVVALSELRARRDQPVLFIDVVVVEELGKPLVDGLDVGVFADVDGLWVLVLEEGVLGSKVRFEPNSLRPRTR